MRRLRFGCVFLLILPLFLSTAAQNRNNWFSSDWADAQWLNFGATNPPSVTQLFFGAGNLSGFLGTMSDASGNLLMFNHSIYAFNSNGQVIGGASTQWDPSMTTWGSIILPSHNGEVYGVFITGLIQNNPSMDCGYYEVDMAANNDEGEVIGFGALILEYNVLAGVASTPHANGQDYWVAFHADASNTWYLFKYGPSGLDPMPVVSQTGIDLEANNLLDSQIKFSYQGDKLAFQTYTDTLELFEFDDATGNVMHLASLPTPHYSYSLEFSPSGQYLYMITSVADSSSIFQWDLELPPSQISASRTNVFSATLTTGSYNVGMALAPDGRIYFPHDVTPYYSRIEFPDLGGVACTVVEDVIGSSPAELTPFINNHCKRYHDSEMAVSVPEQDRGHGIQLWPNPSQDKIWLELFGVQGKMRLEWYDAMGRTVREEERMLIGSRMELDISELSPGHYLLRVIGDGQLATAKVLVE